MIFLWITKKKSKWLPLVTNYITIIHFRHYSIIHTVHAIYIANSLSESK